MNIIGLLFLIITQYFTGRGLLYSFDIRLKPMPAIALSMISGIMVFSFLPLILALLHISITLEYITISIIVTTIAINITHFKKYTSLQFSTFTSSLRSIPLYELVFIIFFILLLFPSVWHCYYWPPNARDTLSGPEALAEFAVREKKFINSFFTVDLESTNNHLKPPFVADLQIIYKLLVQPFGQIWLSIIALSFVTFFYNALKEITHPVLAGILLLLFICAPEVYAYSFIIMFDYCNMILFFLVIYFLIQYHQTHHYKTFLFACLLAGFATFIRLETIILLCMLLPMVWVICYKAHLKLVKWISGTALFIGIPYLIYYIWMGVFVKYYFPVKFDVGSQISVSFHGFSPLIERFTQMNTDLLYGGLNLELFGQIFNLLVIILVADIVIFRKYPAQKVFLLYAIFVVYIGLPVIGYLIPWFDLRNTTKRGLFKLVPIALFYMANSGLFNKLSALIYNWEKGISASNTKPSKVPVAQNNKAKSQRKK